MKVSLKFVFDEIGGVERELMLGKAQFSEISDLIDKASDAKVVKITEPLQLEISALNQKISDLEATAKATAAPPAQ